MGARRSSRLRRTGRRTRPELERRTGTERRAMDPEAGALVPAFVENRQADAASIPALVHAREFEQVGRLGHNMKGNAESFGFPHVGAVGAAMERAAGHEDSVRVLELNEELGALLAMMVPYRG